MRPRTFILLILVLLVGAVAAVLLLNNAGGLFGPRDSGPTETATETGESQEEPGIPPPEPTPSVRLEPVVVAALRLPVGTRLTSDLLTVEMRPNTNIALQGGYTFSEIEPLLGQIVKVEVDRGQAILRPMIALNANDLSAFGSDLALYIEQGRVAIAFPINRYSGAAFALRPGDMVDVMMSLSMVDLDPEFQSILPNLSERIDEASLLEGTPFLFPSTLQGRLELIDELGQVAEIAPGVTARTFALDGSVQMPRRATQLTIQQATVLAVGTYQDTRTQGEVPEDLVGVDEPVGGVGPTPTPIPRREALPDVVILSMPVQDALVLKWAQEVGIRIDLALRAQGDTSVFDTVSITLPQIVDQGILALPEPLEFGLDPRVDQVPPPAFPTPAP